MPSALVSTPPFAAVAAIERASISATDAIWLLAGLLPSLDSKLRVVCLIDSALLAGTSPAPKHGPQNALLTLAPLLTRSAIAPFLNKS